MKVIYIFIILFGLLSCNNQSKNIDKLAITNIGNQNEKNENSNYHTEKDTVVIKTELGDLKLSKLEFNNIVDKHSEFFKEHPDNPDQAYFNNNDKEEFSSEVGQDTYYVLYAYFLKKKNGEGKFSKQRQKLIDIYININSLFQRFQYGGTYFGHQYSRILGYAEYSIYLMPKNKDALEKTYNITKQKNLYIKSLRQLIEDESTIDFNTLGEEKEKRNKELNKIVDELEKLITNNFYLRRTQEFHYRYYEYY